MRDIGVKRGGCVGPDLADTKQLGIEDEPIHPAEGVTILSVEPCPLQRRSAPFDIDKQLVHCPIGPPFLYLLNPAEWPILHLELRESPDMHSFLVALPFQ